MDFSQAELRGGVFSGLSFRGCDLRHAHLDDADLRACHFEDCFLEGGFFTAARLEGTRFRACGLLGTCFDGAKVEGASWVQCRDIDRLKTDAATYEAIADIMAGQWRSGRGQPWAGADREQLYKTYQIIVLEDDANPDGQRALSAQGRDALLVKARKLHDELEAAPASPRGTGQDETP